MKNISLKERKVSPVDLMDEGLDQLRTVWLALHARGLLSDDMIEAVTNALNDVILKLEPLRAALNADHGRS